MNFYTLLMSEPESLCALGVGAHSDSKDGQSVELWVYGNSTQFFIVIDDFDNNAKNEEKNRTFRRMVSSDLAGLIWLLRNADARAIVLLCMAYTASASGPAGELLERALGAADDVHSMCGEGGGSVAGGADRAWGCFEFALA